MFRALLPLLACPECHAPVSVEGSGVAAPGAFGVASVGDAVLVCGRGHRWPIRRGIPRFTNPPEAAAASVRRAFERQWRRYGALPRLFGKTRRQMRENLGNERMGSTIRAPWYAGKWVLDAGCGRGRYLSEFAALGATAVGVDFGTGPEEARVPLDDPRIHVVQGDVLNLPFADGRFDLAFCDGVLHHTTDPRRGFAELARVVKPGGAVYAWLYPREGRLREAFFGAARAVTTRLPGAILRWLCFAAAPLTALVRSYSGTRFPSATWAECAQVAHDWLAPALQSHHRFDEVAAWAREEGLTGVERLPVDVGVVAWKPLPAAAFSAAARVPVVPV